MVNTPSNEEAGLTEKGSQSIDSILSRIEFGKYQIYIFCVAGIGQVADGVEMTAIGAIFLGMILGNALTAFLGDTYGRLSLMRNSTLLLFFAGLLSGMMPEYWSFLCTRFFVGLAAGILVPISATYCTEVCPKEHRGRFLVALDVCFVLGMLIIIGLTLAFIQTIGNSAWRYVLIAAALPVLLAYILQLFLIQESPRYLASQYQHSAAIASLNTMAVCNGKAELSPAESSAVEEFRPLALFPGLEKVKMLFERGLGRVTAQLMLLWTAAVFTYYGLIFIIPVTLIDSSPQASYFLLIFIALVQLPAIAVNIYAIEHRHIGRKHTITLALAAQTVCFVAAALANTSVTLWAALASAMFFISIWFNTLYPYTGEVYHTSIRTLAFGCLNIVGRSGGVVAPMLLLALKNVSDPLPFLFLGLVSLLAAINAFFLPYETRDTELDVHKN